MFRIISANKTLKSVNVRRFLVVTKGSFYLLRLLLSVYQSVVIGLCGSHWTDFPKILHRSIL